MYILTCNAAVWSRFVRWVYNVAFIAFIAFFYFIFHAILTIKCVSVCREIQCHKNRWENGEDSECNHECYFQFWKWKSRWCIVVVGHYITTFYTNTICCRLIYQLDALLISHYFNIKSLHIDSFVLVFSSSRDWCVGLNFQPSVFFVSNFQTSVLFYF